MNCPYFKRITSLIEGVLDLGMEQPPFPITKFHDLCIMCRNSVKFVLLHRLNKGLPKLGIGRSHCSVASDNENQTRGRKEERASRPNNVELLIYRICQ